MEVIAKDSLVHGRKLKVQRLVIPFSIVGNSTSTSVTQVTDEPGILFIKTEGVDNIDDIIESDETAPTFGDAATNSTGVFNACVWVRETVAKVCSARLYRRGSTIATAGAQVVSLGTSTGIVQLTAGGNSDKIVLSCDCDVALNASNTANLCLEVEYIVES